MKFEATGKVIAQPTKATGMGQSGPWVRTNVVIEIPEGQYSTKLSLECRNQRAEEFSRLMVGQQVKVSFTVGSREYNGKWYTTATCIDFLAAGAAVSAPTDEAF